MERAKLSKYNVRYVSDYAKESTKQGVCARVWVVLGFSGRVAREGLTGKATFECRPEGGGGGGQLGGLQTEGQVHRPPGPGMRAAWEGHGHGAMGGAGKVTGAAAGVRRSQVS